MIMVNQSRQHSSFDLEDQLSSAGSSKARPKLNMSDPSISSNKGSDVTEEIQMSMNKLSEGFGINETATKNNEAKSIADILKFPSPHQSKQKRANKKKTKSSRTNHKPYFIDKNRDQSDIIEEQGFITGAIGEQKNEIVDLASDESRFLDNQYPDEQNSSVDVLNEAPLTYKFQQKTISEKPNYDRLENNFSSPISSFTDVDDTDSDLVSLEKLAGNIENEDYYKSDFEAIQGSTASTFLNASKFNHSENGGSSSESLSMDDDFRYKCYKRINIKKLSRDDVEYSVLSSAVEEDDTPENVGNLSQVSKSKDSLLFKFKSNKLKYQTSPPKRTGQHTLNFLKQTPSETENKQFLVKIASPKLKHSDVERIEKEIFASNKYKQANLKNLLMGKVPVSKNSKKDSKLKAPLQKQQIVKLKLPKKFLREVQLRLEAQDFAVKNPFFTAGSKGRVDESDSATSSFFTSVKERSKLADANKTSKRQVAASNMKKLDSLPTRPMVRDEFHVMPETETLTLAKKICLSPKDETMLDYSQCMAGTLNAKLANEVGNNSAQGIFRSFYKYYLKGEFEDKVMIKFRNTFENPKFAKFLDKGVFHCSSLESSHLWTERFKPTSIGESLIAEDDSRSIFSWLKDSFLLLEKNYQLKIRQSYIKEKTEGVKKRNRAYSDYDLDDFVVPDFESTDADATGYNDSLRYDSSISIFDNIKNDAPFVPLMILAGPTGCGKTASIYASTQELNGYVHEINTNQNHSKKALQKTLKELSTSKIVHQKKQKSVTNFFSKHRDSSSAPVAAVETDFAFQNGIILFENADVLFKNHDKGFWDLLNSILQVTRKPIVLTCSDITMIPNNLVSIAEEQNSLIELSKLDEQELFLYLKLVASSFRFEVEDSIVQDLIENSNKDLRYCLTNLQFLCEGCADAKMVDTCKSESKDDEAGIIDITDIDDDGNMEAFHSNADSISHKVITLQYSDNFNASKREAWQEQQEKFPKSVVEFSKYADLLSMADVIETGSKSSLYKVNLVNRIDDFEDQESTDILEFDKDTVVFDIQNDNIYDNYQDNEILIANDEEKTKMVNDKDIEVPRTLNFELNIGMEIKKQYIPTLLMGYRIKFNKYRSSEMGLVEYQDDVVLQQDQDLYDYKVKFLRFPDKRAIVDVFMNFLQLKIRRFLINPRITRSSLNILSNSIFEEADIVKINDSDSINTLNFDTIIVEIGPILRDFARTNINRYKHNEYLKQNSGLTEHQLVHSGILKPLKFELNEAVFAKLFSTLGITEAQL